ncbi:galactose-binding domain-like protein [Crepidotus variabilis]|uniref:Galactose-binding domain-like protein n=1 Tax=Crepidotus variabilis TaxID=179855 RepID=A0A9P6EGJ1_9AGAR|nr:galactose-binding domain-like protein [Crepidotus variabilis]
MASNNSETSENSLASELAGGDISNLYRFIDKDNVHGLNLTVPEHAKEVIKPWDRRDDNTIFLESNVDDQLMIHVPFVENVRVKSIILKLGRGEVAPRHLRVWANKSTIIDFSDVDSIKPQLSISLLEGETGVIEYPMRVAAFASIHSLSLLFDDALGGDQTRLYFIGFKGDTRSVKREINSRLEVPAPNAADASISDRVSNRVGGQQTTAR